MRHCVIMGLKTIRNQTNPCKMDGVIPQTISSEIFVKVLEMA